MAPRPYIVFRLEDRGRYALMQMRRDGSHLRTILALSSFGPGYIDWSTSEVSAPGRL